MNPLNNLRAPGFETTRPVPVRAPPRTAIERAGARPAPHPPGARSRGRRRRRILKVIQRVRGGVLLGPFMCGWTTVVQPSFSRVKRASRRPGRSGAGRRGPRDRRVTAEHVT